MSPQPPLYSLLLRSHHTSASLTRLISFAVCFASAPLWAWPDPPAPLQHPQIRAPTCFISSPRSVESFALPSAGDITGRSPRPRPSWPCLRHQSRRRVCAWAADRVCRVLQKSRSLCDSVLRARSRGPCVDRRRRAQPKGTPEYEQTPSQRVRQGRSRLPCTSGCHHSDPPSQSFQTAPYPDSSGNRSD